MRGLYRKDLFGLKKMLYSFALISAIVFFISILCILSMRYGNLLLARQTIGEKEFRVIFRLETIFPLLIPIAFMGEVNSCFASDEKAGFWKLVKSMPVSPGQIVLSRYLTLFTMAGIGLTVSFPGAFVIGGFSDILKMSELLAFPFILCCALLIGISLGMPIAYRFGSRMNIVVMIVVVIGALAGFEAYVLLHTANMSEAETEAFIEAVLNKGSMLLHSGRMGLLLFLITVVCVVISFWISVEIVKRKKG